MDALFSLNPTGFRQAANHIALYRIDPSPHYAALAHEASSAVDDYNRSWISKKLFGSSSSSSSNSSTPTSVEPWNVPGLGGLLGKALPIDVHGPHMFFDEPAIADAALLDSVVRYHMLTGCLKTSQGGRLWYDLKTMNGSLLVGALAGGGFLTLGRRRWRWMRTRPYARVAVSFALCVTATLSTKAVTRMLGLGVFAAQRNFHTAADLLACEACLGEVQQFTELQAEDVAQYNMPTKLPNGQELPEPLVAAVKRGNDVNAFVLKENAATMKRIQHRFRGRYCAGHEHEQRNKQKKASSAPAS